MHVHVSAPKHALAERTQLVATAAAPLLYLTVRNERREGCGACQVKLYSSLL